MGPITLEALAFFRQAEGQALLAQVAAEGDLLALQHRLRIFESFLCFSELFFRERWILSQ